MTQAQQTTPTKVMFSRLTGAQARTWLMENDPEGEDIWSEKLSKSELIGAVEDNLATFGINIQGGSIQITSNHEAFQDENIQRR